MYLCSICAVEGRPDSEPIQFQKGLKLRLFAVLGSFVSGVALLVFNTLFVFDSSDLSLPGELLLVTSQSKCHDIRYVTLKYFISNSSNVSKRI